MTILELIQKLQGFPQKADIIVVNSHGDLLEAEDLEFDVSSGGEYVHIDISFCEPGLDNEQLDSLIESEDYLNDDGGPNPNEQYWPNYDDLE